jgi:hypothetical protein
MRLGGWGVRGRSSGVERVHEVNDMYIGFGGSDEEDGEKGLRMTLMKCFVSPVLVVSTAGS